MTGADGNLGSALRESGAAEIVSLGRADWARLPDLLASGIDAVLHAASDLKTPLTQNPGALLDANLMTTMRLIEACRAHRIRKFAFVSTCAVYGESMNTAEDAACCPVSVNGITKLLNERVIEAFCAANGIDCQIYRVFNMFGGNARFSILSHLRRALAQGTPFTLNNSGVAQRDFIHVTDVANIVLALLPQKLPAVHVNVGTGRATRIADIVGIVRRFHPELLVSHQTIAEAEYSRADITRLRSIVDEPRFVDVKTFVKDAYGGDRFGASRQRADDAG